MLIGKNLIDEDQGYQINLVSIKKEGISETEYNTGTGTVYTIAKSYIEDLANGRRDGLGRYILELYSSANTAKKQGYEVGDCFSASSVPSKVFQILEIIGDRIKYKDITLTGSDTAGQEFTKSKQIFESNLKKGSWYLVSKTDTSKQSAPDYAKILVEMIEVLPGKKFASQVTSKNILMTQTENLLRVLTELEIKNDIQGNVLSNIDEEVLPE